MPQAVTLVKGDQMETVIAEEVSLKDVRAKLVGVDPQFYPFDSGAEDVIFFSGGPTLIINQSADVEVACVEPTDEPVPEPDVSF